MLAQNLKTSTELGILDAEFEALLKVLGMLERGELRHSFPLDAIRKTSIGFSMNFWGYEPPAVACGTVHCIGGWAEAILGKPFKHYDRKSNLGRLFWPRQVAGWDRITPSHAAIALRNYLTHGEPRWAETLAEYRALSVRERED